MLRRAPLIPVHHFVFDPMHGMHNEANVLLDESVHKHLMVESEDPQVKASLAKAQASINADWKAANLPKFIQFGRDAQGAHSHAMNGPACEAVMDNPGLLIRTIDHMKPVYDLLETRKLTPALDPSAVAPEADTGKTTGGNKSKGGVKGKTKERAKKKRKVSWGKQPQAAEQGGGQEGPPTEPEGDSEKVRQGLFDLSRNGEMCF